MKTKILHVIFFILLCLEIHNINNAITVISLGGDCQAAYYLRKYNLRHEAFPFDWLRSYKFEGVCKLIENNFDHLLEEKYLEYKGYGIVNKLYNIEFVHDFPTVGSPSKMANENEYCGTVVTNYRNYLPEANNKFNVRINRFTQALKSKEFIYFIRTNITREEALKYILLIKNKYPECNFSLIVVHANKSLKNKWHMPNVQDFYAEEKIPALNNWWSDNEWIKIFQELKLPINLKKLKLEHSSHICNNH